MRLALIDPACEVTVPENLQARIPSRSFREPLGIGSSGPQSHIPLQEPESRCGRLEAVCPSEQGPSSSKGPSDLYCDASSSFSPQEGLMVLATLASVVASVSSLQPGKWFVMARAVCGELATYIFSGHGRPQQTLRLTVLRASTCGTQTV